MESIFIIIGILIVLAVVLILINKYVAMGEPIKSLVNILIILVFLFLIWKTWGGFH